jgi:hypothetical protein
MADETVVETPETVETPDRMTQAMEAFQREVLARVEAVDQKVTRSQEALAALSEPDEPAAADEPVFVQPQYDPQRDFDAQGQITQEAAQRALNEIVASQVELQVEKRLAPERQERIAERRWNEAVELEKKYPQLADEEFSQRMLDKAERFAKAQGNPELLLEPALLELVYLSELGGERAAQGSSAGADRDVPLESASGAGGTEDVPEDDIADRLVKLAGRKRLF